MAHLIKHVIYFISRLNDPQNAFWSPRYDEKTHKVEIRQELMGQTLVLFDGPVWPYTR